MNKSLLARYILLAIIITGICTLVYTANQQSLRQSANDPQIQIAEDAAVSLSSGMSADFGTDRFDLSTSLAEYIVVFDKTGSPISSNAQLNNALPMLPSGVFAYTDKHGEDRFTWKPQNNVRDAVVVVKVPNPTGGYVAVGRSLREIERREQQQLVIAVVAWGVFMLLLLLGYYLEYTYLRRWMIKKGLLTVIDEPTHTSHSPVPHPHEQNSPSVVSPVPAEPKSENQTDITE